MKRDSQEKRDIEKKAYKKREEIRESRKGRRKNE